MGFWIYASPAGGDRMSYIYNDETKEYTVIDKNGAIIWWGKEDEFNNRFYKCELCEKLVDRDELDDEYAGRCHDIGMDLCEYCLDCDEGV